MTARITAATAYYHDNLSFSLDWVAADIALAGIPQSNSWGLHDFTAADPDGNLFRVFYDFATPRSPQWRKA